jgi:TonB family protein
MREFWRSYVWGLGLLLLLPMVSPATAREPVVDATKPEPLGSPGSWLTDQDYPVAANLDGTEGRVGFQLEVGVDGRVVNCIITSSSGSDILDETTCTVIKERARFKTALNKENIPIPGSYNGRVTWRIPQNHALRLADYPKRLHLSFDVDENGVTENCKVMDNVGNATFVAALSRSVNPCEVMMKRNRPSPILDADGNPVKAHVETVTETKITPR